MHRLLHVPTRVSGGGHLPWRRGPRAPAALRHQGRGDHAPGRHSRRWWRRFPYLLQVHETPAAPDRQRDRERAGLLGRQDGAARVSGGVPPAFRGHEGDLRIRADLHGRSRERQGVVRRLQEHAADGLYDIRYVPDTYALGEEKTLIKHSTDTKVPLFLDTPDGKRRPGMPPDVGIVVNNSETLLNVYNALFLGKPTTTTFFTVYGEEIDLKVYEAPIGASFAEILGIAGLDVENSAHLSLLDGGPYLHDMAIEEIGNGDGYVRRMTNALFVIAKDRQGKEYADIKTPPPEEGIVSLVGEVSGVHIPLGGGLLKPAIPLVSEGDQVEYEQKLGEPVDEGFSIGVWASMGGEISSIENDIVAIGGGAVPQEEAEAEAEASKAGGAPPRGEAESFQEAETKTGR